ncbi:hypothetical protein, partial [Gluconacetobacter dulcium]|uniref:hypothetical protein n=1 Tax=Gluconacetobacter dulcium TaxID=2729096 RepID=UPI001C7EB37B
QRPKQSNSKAIKTHKSKKYASQRPKQASIKPRLNPDQTNPKSTRFRRPSERRQHIPSIPYSVVKDLC